MLEIDYSNEKSHDLPVIIKALLEPEAYPFKPSWIELIQTHISYILLTPDFAYKIKKPVDFEFLDFSTIEKRMHFCKKEVELNRRLSPQTYLGVVTVTERDGKFFMEGRGRKVEYAVKMKRLPQEKMMDRLLRRGKVSKEMIGRIAKRMALFYASEKTNEYISSFGGPELIGKNTEENFRQTESYRGKTVFGKEFEDIKKYTEEFLWKNKGLFKKRISGGWIKDCHGDLHSESICLTDDIVIFDCIEFNERFRYSDTVADIAFLAMDLDFHFRSDLSMAWINAYKEFSGDRDINKILTFYKIYRAYVRGKVESFEIDESEVPDKEKERLFKRTRRYFHLAHMYTKGKVPPILIVVCGLLGTGKTCLSKEIGRRFNALVIHSDIVRKRLANIPLGEHRYVPFGKDIYSKDFDEKTYGEVCLQAEKALQKGRNVVLDATFSTRKKREMVLKIAKALDLEIAFVECLIPQDLVKKRLFRRIREEHEIVSDGRWEIYLEAKKVYQPLDDIPDKYLFKADTSMPLQECADSMMNWLGF